MSARRFARAGATLWMLTALHAAGAQQPPRFQSSVEVTPIDVNVVDDQGRPIRDLTPADFTVHVDGNPRRVVSAEWVALVADGTAPAAPAPLPQGYSANENARGGRLIVIAVDEPNIRFGGALGVLNAASAFIDRLSPADRIAAIGLGTGSPATSFTANRARVREAIARMAGQKRNAPTMMQYNIAASEALAMANGDRVTEQLVVGRECRAERTVFALEACQHQIALEALQMSRDVQQGADQTIRGLRTLLIGLKGIDAPKTLILLSEGFVLDGTASDVIELGTLAANARTSVYALQLDDQLFSVTEARAPVAPFADRRARTEGLDTLAGASRGTLFTVTGTGASIFDRIESELTGYYLLGLESDPRDRDGRPHPIRVDVPRRGAVVRVRRQILSGAAADARPRTPRDAVTAGLSSPLLMSSLSLRVATFSLEGPEQSKVQLLIHADVGNDYTTAKRLALGYMITDGDGRIIDSQAADARLAPPMNGVPSPLEYVAGASLPPGDYTLKLAVADGDRVGSVEHPIHAALVDAGSVKLSELIVGGPVEPGERLRPSIGYAVTFGILHGYLEAYGPQSPSVKVRYEIANDETSPAILTADVPNRQLDQGRALFSHVMSVHGLPSGTYVLRAVVTDGAQPVKTLARAFELAPPRVLMTSAIGLDDPDRVRSADGELFLPIGDASMAAPFRREDAVKKATVDQFRERLAPTPAVRAAFEKGVTFLTAGDDARAEASFKAAIQTDGDSTAALVYLAACFAASGHDTEAASAWQTALVDGSDLPQIYVWLGDALIRSHALGEARSILEEASGRWPADARFAHPLALLYATFGRGREAVRTLERYIADGHTDPETLALGIEWIYEVHAAGGLVHARAEDLKLARSYSDKYARAGGAKTQLVKQWIDYLEREKR